MTGQYMAPADAKAYLTAAFDEIETAIRAGDPPTALAVVRRITADGHPDVAEVIQRGVDALLVAERLRDIAAAIDTMASPTACTSLTARWCPRCGVCTCSTGDEEDLHAGPQMDNPGCPLHGDTSIHSEERP